MTVTTPAPNAWRAPNPRELPDLRARMVEFAGTNINLTGLAKAVDSGKTSMLPVVPELMARSPDSLKRRRRAARTALLDPELARIVERFNPEPEPEPGDYPVGAVAAPILAALEQQRLAEATLFYATADTTSLAVAAARLPPRERFSARRLPAETGLMVFEEPIGGYTIDVSKAVADWGRARPGLTVTTPIVAASWSRWTPHDLTVEGGPAVRWFACLPDRLVPIPTGFDGVWITFYGAAFAKWGEIDPDEPLAENPDGTVMTAGDIATMQTGGIATQLNWDDETVVSWGADISLPPEPDTTTEWLHVLYTAWQLMTQTGGKTPIIETEEVPRQRAGRRRDTRAGIADGTVRIVRVHTAYRPPPEAAAEDAARSTGRRAPNWSCRWPVRPHRRNFCLNPRKHQTGECEHEEKIIPLHIKGPADKPLRVPQTVHLWDAQPDQPQPQLDSPRRK